jgi:ABC-type nitrate/sulfonate/bicarbonate transport system substrate-binding protein
MLRAICFAVAIAVLVSTRAASAAPIRVIVPDTDNLQYMAFWVAKGAGYFRDEGLEIEIVSPPAPAGAEQLVREGKASVFVLPPPLYISLIGAKFPLYLVANLLQNDPINLVVRRSVFEERKMDARAPIDARLKSLSGLRVGVAPGPPTRLRALFKAYGMDADKDIRMVIVRGPDQNDAFARGDLDAIYCHTPFLERALVEQDAVMLVEQSRGEVPSLATRQIHALAVTRDLADRNRDTVAALVRAVARAEALVHTNPGATVDAIVRELPSTKRALVETIVRIYEPAVPKTPQVSADAIEGALAMFPANKSPPDLSKIDRRDYVAPAFADNAVKPPRATYGRFVPLAVLVGVALLAVAVATRKRRAS